MSIAIHFSGAIKDLSAIPDLVAEVADICRSIDWKFHIIREHPNPLQVKGIHFTPTDCDQVFLTFLPNGRICSIAKLICKNVYRNCIDQDEIYTVTAKTQECGPQTHLTLVNLLTYVAKKYLSCFEMVDEADYQLNGEWRMIVMT